MKNSLVMAKTNSLIYGNEYRYCLFALAVCVLRKINTYTKFIQILFINFSFNRVYCLLLSEFFPLETSHNKLTSHFGYGTRFHFSEMPTNSLYSIAHQIFILFFSFAPRHDELFLRTHIRFNSFQILYGIGNIPHNQ